MITPGAILCFHSITTGARPAAGSAHVSFEAFTSFVRVARRFGEIVPLSELLRRRAHGRSTAGLIALTFDDAYAALLEECKEFISRHAVPVSIFVATGAASSGAAFWWDRVDDLFPRVASDRWRAFEEACGVPKAYLEGQPAAYGPLRPLRQWLLARHCGRWPDDLEAALRQLERDIGYQTPQRSMTFQELATLASLPDLEFGVHTVSHPVLPLLSDRMVRHEIESAAQALHGRFSNVIPVLAIPFGLFDARTIRIARAAGMLTSLTLAGTLSEAHDLRALPRLCMTRNDTAVKLALRLIGVPHLMRNWSGGRAPAYPDLPSATT